MKPLTLAAVASVGLLVTSSSAQAQFPQYGRTYYSVPSYTAPSYSYSFNRYGSSSFNRFGGYSFNNFNRFNSAPFGYQGAGAPPVPRYDGVHGVGTYTPLGGTTIITGGSSFTPSQRFYRRR